MKRFSFSEIAIVSCGTLSLEIRHLQEEGFLDTEKVFFTTPGLHQDIKELERQLLARIEKATAGTKGVLVIYGGKFCYVNADNPTRTIDKIISESGANIRRINATHCMDMLASEEERERIAQEMAGGEKVWWMTPGWVKFKSHVFKGWDKAMANENFPRHSGGAIVLDGIGFMEKYMAENPEDFLEYCDWMGIPMQAYPISLDRFKGLIQEQAERLLRGD